MTNSTTFPGTLTCPTSLVSNVMTMGTTKTFVVTVSDASGATKYYIDGYLQASLVLHQGQTYIFDLSSSTLSGHPFIFSESNSNDGTTNGTPYTTGITTTGTYASSEKRTFIVSASTPTTLYYYCTAHSGMGGSVSISSEAELLVSGGAEFLGTGTIKLPSGTTAQRPTTGILGSIRYNTTTGFMETYTSVGWGAIGPQPTITEVSPLTVAGGSTATQVFTVTGTNFDDNGVVKLVGANGTEYSVFDKTVVSVTSVTFKMGVFGATGGYDAAQRPFSVKFIAGSGLDVTSDTTINLIAPTISGVSPTTLAGSAVGSQTITVTGTGFTSSMASGNNIQVLGNDGTTLYNVDSAAVVSATSITFKLAATSGSLSSGQLANRPYKVRVTGAAGLTATSTQTVGFAGLSWTSPAAGASLPFVHSENKSYSLVATDEVGGTDVTFSITSGSVSGLSLGSASASPATYGGSTTSTTTTNIVFRITDNVSGATLDRTFSVSASGLLYSFTQHTFKNGNYNGKYGPPVSACRSYAPAPWAPNNSYFYQGTTTGYQLWTVPVTATYRITTYGASGGQNNVKTPETSGVGAIIRGDFVLTKNSKIQIVVGQKGGNQSPTSPASNADRHGAGGGGGSFVFKYPFTQGDADDLYIAAGGGGGVGETRSPATGSDGVAANAAASTKSPGSMGGWTSGGGAGWGTPSPDGGYGGTNGGSTDRNFYGGEYTNWDRAISPGPRPNGRGGFGGGGGSSTYQGAGAGGYFGGQAGSANGTGSMGGGGGGGSRSNSSILTTIVGQHSKNSHGQVIIQRL